MRLMQNMNILNVTGGWKETIFNNFLRKSLHNYIWKIGPLAISQNITVSFQIFWNKFLFETKTNLKELRGSFYHCNVFTIQNF